MAHGSTCTFLTRYTKDHFPSPTAVICLGLHGLSSNPRIHLVRRSLLAPPHITALPCADDPTVSQCAADADDTLFRAVLACDHHVLRHLLPDRTSHSYSLRPRRHDCSLTIKADSRNFITRQRLKTCTS